MFPHKVCIIYHRSSSICIYIKVIHVLYIMTLYNAQVVMICMGENMQYALYYWITTDFHCVGKCFV